MARGFQVDLRGVVELLARHVYSSPRVFIRELLQNGVDAVTARRLLDPSAPLGPVLFQPADAGGRGTLVVRDPGIGITADEVHELLATIGASSKRDGLDLPRSGFLGRFGVGLLSCFVIAERIEVRSRSARGGATVLWTGHDDGTYDVEELPDTDERALASPGTTVVLDPRPGMAEWVDAAMVELLAGRFGSALAVPVLVERPDGSQVPISDPEPPWADPTRRAAQEAWCERHLGFAPLALIPVSVPLVGLVGTGFVLPYEGHPGARPTAHVHLSGMLVGDEVVGLSPDWAFFVRFVVNASDLNPTASRESLVDDEVLAATRDALGAQVRDWMVGLGATDPDLLRRVMGVHARAAKGLAVHDLGAFAELLPWLPFETSEGVVTLTEVFERSATLRFTRTVDRFRQLVPIAVAQGVVLVNGGYTYDVELLERIGEVLPGAEAVEVGDDEIVAILDDVDADRRWVADRFLRAATAALTETGCQVELRAFDPESVPALLLQESERARVQDLRNAQDEVTDPLWADLLAAVDDGSDAGPRLVCNDRNDLVRTLVGSFADDTRSEARDQLLASAVGALYVQALLLGRHPVRGGDLGLLARSLTTMVEVALRGAEEADG